MKKGTLAVLGVFALLLVLVLATREKKVSVGVRKLTVAKLDKAKVSELSLSGAKAATLTKEADGWVVADPASPAAKHPADGAQVDAAIEAINELQDADFISDRPEKATEAEADDAKGLKLAVSEGGAKKVELVLGKASQSGGNYLRKAGTQELFVYRGRLDWTVRKDAKAWRKKTVLSAKVEDVKRLTLKGQDGAEVKLLAGDAPGKWQLEGTPTPPDYRFDPQAAQTLATQLVNLTAQDFLEGADAADDKTGLGGPHDSVEAELKDGKKLVVHLGPQPDASKPGALVAAKVDGDPQIYQLAPYTAAALRKHLEELRDLSLFTFEPGAVKALRFNVGGKKVELAKQGEEWKITEPKQLPAGFEYDPAQVGGQLGVLRSLRALKVAPGKVADGQTGLAAAPLTVQVELNGAPAQVLRLGKGLPVEGGKGTPTEVYARTSVDPLTYVVSEATRARLATGLELFKKQPPPPAFGGMGGGGQIKGLESLPPEVRKQLEAQLRARGQGQGHP